jgi:hypothetical protein
MIAVEALVLTVTPVGVVLLPIVALVVAWMLVAEVADVLVLLIMTGCGSPVRCRPTNSN